MTNDEYYAINKITHKEDELKTLIEKIVYPIPEDIKYYNSFSEESVHNQLTDTDKTALAKYVPILFDVFVGSEHIRFPKKLFELKWSSNFHSLTLKDFQYQYNELCKPYRQSLEDAIFLLVKSVWNYRLTQSPDYAINYVKNNNFKRYAKDQEGKLKSFYGHIDSLIELMGGNFSSGTPEDPNMPTPAEFKTMLKYVKEHSEIYLVSKPTASADKKIFKDYLRGLNLYDKSDIIKDFAKHIKKSTSKKVDVL